MTWWTVQVKLTWVDRPTPLGPFGVTVYPGETHTATASFPREVDRKWIVHGQSIKEHWLEFVSDKLLLEDRTTFIEAVFRKKSNVVEIKREKL
jgi:hypothetical protein